MSYKVFLTPNFEREIKRLSKKYPSLKSEVSRLVSSLKETPGTTGTPLGQGAFKIRIGIASKGRGKSGGGRIISFLLNERQEVWLLSIYDKSEKEDIPDKELLQLISIARAISDGLLPEHFTPLIIQEE